MASAKDLLRSIVPPVLWKAGQGVKRRASASVTQLQHAPQGWATRLPAGRSGDDYWTAFIDQERAAFETLRARIVSGQPAFGTDAGEEIKYLSFAYVIALASAGGTSLRVLDYGGNFGEYFWIARAMVPDVTLDYHCRELPAIADAARLLNPSVTFHADDDCLDQRYDVVMFCSSLECIPDWTATLAHAARATNEVLFLSDVSTVRNAGTFAITHRTAGRTTLQHVFNRDELIAAVAAAGLSLWREFPMRAQPVVHGAPEQPSATGYLFRRSTTTAVR